jgi:hypothetical protein
VTLELGAKPRVIGDERRADVLRVPPLGLRSRADEVGEQNRHDLALFEQATGRRGERGSATRAKSRFLRAFPPARLAHDHIHGYRLGAYPLSGGIGKRLVRHLAAGQKGGFLVSRRTPQRHLTGNRRTVNPSACCPVRSERDQSADRKSCMRDAGYVALQFPAARIRGHRGAVSRNVRECREA